MRRARLSFFFVRGSRILEVLHVYGHVGLGGLVQCFGTGRLDVHSIGPCLGVKGCWSLGSHLKSKNTELSNMRCC